MVVKWDGMPGRNCCASIYEGRQRRFSLCHARPPGSSWGFGIFMFPEVLQLLYITRSQESCVPALVRLPLWNYPRVLTETHERKLILAYGEVQHAACCTRTTLQNSQRSTPARGGFQRPGFMLDSISITTCIFTPTSHKGITHPHVKHTHIHVCGWR